MHAHGHEQVCFRPGDTGIWRNTGIGIVVQDQLLSVSIAGLRYVYVYDDVTYAYDDVT